MAEQDALYESWCTVGTAIGLLIAECTKKRDFPELRALTKTLAHFNDDTYCQWAATRAAWELYSIATFPNIPAQTIRDAGARIALNMHASVRLTFPELRELNDEIHRRLLVVQHIMSINPLINRSGVVNLLIYFILTYVCGFDIDALAKGYRKAMFTKRVLDDDDRRSAETTGTEMLNEVLTVFNLEKIRDAILAQGRPDVIGLDIFPILAFEQYMLGYAKNDRNGPSILAAKEVSRLLKPNRGAGCLFTSLLLVAGGLALVVVFAMTAEAWIMHH